MFSSALHCSLEYRVRERERERERGREREREREREGERKGAYITVERTLYHTPCVSGAIL